MAIEDGQDYNPETARDLRPRSFVFDGYGVEFRYTLQIPEYITKRLNSTVMCQLDGYMTGYAQRVVLEGMRGGYVDTQSGLDQMRINATWQVAPSLQEARR